MNPHVNPFRFQGPILKEDPDSGCTLVHRGHVLCDILGLIENGEHVQVVGPHQSGRSTLAIDLIDQLLPDNGVEKMRIPVLVSCESLIDASREGFIYSIVTRIATTLTTYPDIGKRIQPELLLNVDRGIPKTFLDLHLRLCALGDAIRQSEEYSALVIIVDEIEALPDALSKEVLVFFRGLFSHYAERRWESPYRVVILTTRDVAYLKLGNTSPYNVSHLVHLPPFLREELDRMLDREHTGKVLAGITFEDAAVERIYAETGGHPYFVQRLCHVLVERRNRSRGGTRTVRDEDLRKAVLELFEEGDESLRAVYEDVPLDSDEWRLCRRLIAGHREEYVASDPAIARLAEQGVVGNVDHYCCISSGIYRRQILRRCFHEQFRMAGDLLDEREQLVADVSCLQEILINSEIGQLVIEKATVLKQDKRRTEEKIFLELSRFLGKTLRDRHLDLDIDDIHAHTGYYQMDGSASREKALELLARAFVKMG